MSRVDKLLVILGIILVVFCSVCGAINFWHHKIGPGVVQMSCAVVNTVTVTQTLCRVHYMKREKELIDRIRRMFEKK